MNRFARLTFPYDTFSQDFYDDIPCDALVIYEHTRDETDPVNNRTHIHLVILGLQITVQGLKDRITSYLNTQVHKSDWSFKKINNINEVPKILVYMSKGKYIPKYVRDFEIDNLAIISAWENYGNLQRPMRQLKITQLGSKEYKQTYNDLIDKIINILEEGGDYQPRQIIETIISVFRKERIIIGRYKIRDIYDTVYMRKLPEHYIEKLMSELKV